MVSIRAKNRMDGTHLKTFCQSLVWHIQYRSRITSRLLAFYQACSIKVIQIVGYTPSETYSQITWYSITQRGSVADCLASVILLGEKGKEKA